MWALPRSAKQPFVEVLNEFLDVNCNPTRHWPCSSTPDVFEAIMTEFSQMASEEMFKVKETTYIAPEVKLTGVPKNSKALEEYVRKRQLEKFISRQQRRKR